jgi:homeobox protein cut-like
VQLEQEGWEPGQAAALLAAQGAPAMLQERNRKLAAELHSARLQLAEQEGKGAQLAQQACLLEAQLGRQQQLVARLEEDLANSSLGGAAGGAGAAQLLSAESVAAAAVAGLQPSSPGGLSAHPLVLSRAGSELPASPLAGAGPGPASGGEGLLDIVVSQRDRFRARLAQVEEEKGALEAQVQVGGRD